MLRFALFVWVAYFTVSVSAHQQRPAIVDIEFFPDRHFTLRVETNLEARMAGISPKHADTDDSPQAREYARLRALPAAELEAAARIYEPHFRQGLELRFSNQPVRLDLTAIEVQAVDNTELPRLSTLLYSGAVPDSASEAVWQYSKDYGDNVVRVAIAGNPNKVSHWLKDGAASPAFRPDARVAPRSTADIATVYSVLGFEHIIPKGIDHILFVLGLFLLSLSWRSLLWQVTAFTVAHTITLALAILGYISLSPAIIEPLIALSIAYVGIENVLTRKLHAWRTVIVFLFGLLHGMGFASVLADIGLPPSDLAAALISFNIGVELGQLAVIAAAFVLALPLRSRPEMYRCFVVVPGSLAIAAIGLYWTWERVLG